MDINCISRRAFLERSGKTALAGASALAMNHAAFAQEEKPSERPNVVIVITDDQGWADLGLHGNEHVRTPYIDRFAGQSVEFTQFYCSPVCAPTRASLMTGRYNYRTGVVDTYIGRALMHSDEVTLAEMLGGAGYKTGIFGKWHLGDNFPLRSMDQGFQENLVHNGGGIGQPSDPPNNHYHDPVLQHNGSSKKYLGYCTDIFTNAAMQFIERNRDEPFFCYLSTNAPHTPLEIEDKYVQPYLDMGLDETTAKVYGMIENIDENVGKLLQKLDDLQLAQNTIVIFLTDNGAQQDRFSAGERGQKGSVYEGGIHVPFFIRWPQKFHAGKQVDRIAAHIDITPTLLEACGVQQPAEVEFDGRSLMPLMLEDRPDWADRTLYLQWHRGDEPVPFKNAAARNQRYKLVNGEELYDMLEDPGEKNNIAGEHPQIVKEMRHGYEAWFKDVSSTRGYDPPRIYLGTKHENPVTLTRQDFRGPRASWNEDGLGHWEVDMRSGGKYDITLRFAKTSEPGSVVFKLGDVSLQEKIKAGISSHTFKNVELKPGAGRLEAWLELIKGTIGVHYVDVRKV